jgi:Protein of unknown function (DUF3253)
MSNKQIESAILALCASRARGGSICPSEVARALWPDAWRQHMSEVREHGRELARRGEIEITQGGIVRDPSTDIRGAIRCRLPL